MLDLFMWAIWFIFGAYSFWFFIKAKTFQSLTLTQLALTWKLHKRETGCRASRINSLLMKNDVVVGFRCNCGYEFLQKRLITQRVPPNAQTTIHEVAQKLKDSLQDTDLDPRRYIK